MNEHREPTFVLHAKYVFRAKKGEMAGMNRQCFAPAVFAARMNFVPSVNGRAKALHPLRPACFA
jgi:hypothetical protein